MGKTRILIVEDNGIIAIDAKRFLEVMGFEVVGIAYSGEEAIRLTDKLNPDLILMDIILSGDMDGITAVEEIKSRHDISVVFMTAHTDEITLKRAKATGPQGYLVKPIKEDDLRSAIEMALYRYEAEQRIKESEKKYRMLVETMNDGICMVDENGLVTYVNERFSERFEYSREEILGTPMLDFFNEKNRRIIADQFVKRQWGEQEPYELEWMMRDGSSMHTIVSPRAIFDERGNFRGSFVVITDITDRKVAEQALKESEENYRSIFNATNEAIFIHDIDTGKIMDVNQTMLEMYGLTYEEALNASVEDLSLGVFPYTQSEAEAIIRKASDEGPQLFEWCAKRKNGEIFWTELTLKRSVIGGKVRVMAVARDISDRKITEEALRRSEEKFRDLVTNMDGIIYTLDREGVITYINDVVRKYGYEPENLMGKNYLELAHDDEKGMQAEKFRNAISGLPIPGESRFRSVSGETRWFSVNETTIYEEGNPMGVRGVMIDITDRKKTEDQLIHERDFSSTVLNTVASLVIVHDSQGRIVTFNRACEKCTGYSFEEVRGRYFWDILILPEETDAVKKVFRDLITEDQPNEFENYWITKSGERRLIEFSNTVLKKPDGSVEYVMSTGIDITDQRRAEESLQESEERFRTIFQESTDAIMILDENSFIDCNSATLKMFGYSNKEEFIGLHPSEISPHYQPDGEESQRLANSMIQEAYRKGSNRFEWLHRRLDGEEFFAEVILTAFQFRGKHLLQAVVRDITDRKRAEDELRISEEKFSRAFMASPHLLAIMTSKEARIVDANDMFLEKLGFSWEEVIGNTVVELKMATPYGRERMLEILNRKLKVRNFETSLRKKSGELILASISAETIEIEGKRHFIFIFEDITETRMLQLELLNIIERERRRIGQDLHDDLGQNLTGATFLIQSLKQDMAEKSYPELAEIEKIDNLIRGAVKKTRNIAKMLSPVEMSESGFLSAIEDMSAQVNEVFGISCQVIKDGDFLLDNDQIATNLYYIAREAVNNAIKHGKAQRIEIYLNSEDSEFVMSIRDDGSGIDESEKEDGIFSLILHRGMGMRIMKYRATLIGSDIDIGNDEDGGCVVRVNSKS